MRVPLLQRELALGAAALLGVVVALAVAAERDEAPAAVSRLPQPAVSNLSGWYPALAGVRKRPLAGRPSGCGTLLDPKTLGVDHPVLPCGAKIFVAYGDKTVLTTVVDRGPLAPGYQFEVTPALADMLGLTGVQKIRWSFARAAGPSG
jgi:rare lipoprotein A (RlpA)-like double-psi beta-barrel protein